MKNNKIRLLLLATLSLATISTYAQVMEWAIRPDFKDIVHIGGSLYKVKGTNGKWGVYNIDRRELTVRTEYDSITPIVENRALILDAQGLHLHGIIDTQGQPVQPLVRTSSLVVMPEYPYYSDGLLVVGNYYSFGYVDDRGNVKIPLEYLYACPFDHGQAMVKNSKKKYQIINKQGYFTYQGNMKIDFMSNPRNGVFILASTSGNKKIIKAKLVGDKIEELEKLDGGKIIDYSRAIESHSIQCKGGSTYSFNNAFHFIESGVPSVEYPAVPSVERYVNLRKEQSGSRYGLTYNRKPLIAPQFADVRIYQDKHAIVTTPEGGMKGLLKLNALGRIDIKTTPQTFDFYHNEPKNIPIQVECSNMDGTPTVELTVSSDGFGSRTFNRQGSGTINVPFYEAHNQKDVVTTKVLTVETVIDGLRYGSMEQKVVSSHKDGFSISIGAFPEYSKKDGSAVVSVTITANGGTPSSSARAVVNGRTHYFNGDNRITTSASFNIPVGKVQNCTVNVAVLEDGCPSKSQSSSRQLKHYSLQ